MLFRCAACRAASPLRASGRGERLQASCTACGRRFRIRDPAALGPTESDRQRAVQELADAAKLDLPGAFAVLIGAMTMAQAREIPAPAPAPRPATMPIPAVVLADRPKKKRSRWLPAVLLAAVILGTGIGFSIWFTSEPLSAEGPIIDSAWLERAVEIRLDDEGRPLSVVSHDARLVLMGYCLAATSEPRCSPLHVAVSDSETGHRFGIFGEPDRPEKRSAIEIRRNPEGFDWVAGDGLRPITPVPEPQVPVGSATIPARR